MIIKTILLYLVATLAPLDQFFGTSMIGRAIIVGPLTGLIMGDLHTGIVIGATMELAFIGSVSIGASDPPDMASGTILGTAFAIQAGAGPEVALAAGLPIATIMLGINTLAWGFFPAIIMHRADKYALEGDTKGIGRTMFLAGFAPILATTWIIPAAFYFGNKTIVQLIDVIPKFVITGMDIAAGVIPAIGFAMLINMIMNKKVAVFFFFGFFVVQYFKISTIGVAIFSVMLAIVLTQIIYGKNNKGETQIGASEGHKTSTIEGVDFDEF